MNREIQFLLYSLPDESGQVQVVIKDETLWCTQKAMAALFGCTTDNISVHLKNIYAQGELVKEATTENFSVVQKEGAREVSRTPVFYNLDAIIAVGYRVSSAKATKFRLYVPQWRHRRQKVYILPLSLANANNKQ